MSAASENPQSLAPSAPALAEKLRRRTPDSEALASSDDEHPGLPTAPRPRASMLQALTQRRPSTTWTQDFTQVNPSMRKLSLGSATMGSQPTTPAVEMPRMTPNFPWNTNPFNVTPSGNQSKDSVPSPNAADDGHAFLLAQPIRKSVRSQSYSIGQKDIGNSPIGQLAGRHSVRHRSSKLSLLGEGLAQLREDDIDDFESSNGSERDHPSRAPPSHWGFDNQALLKQAAEHNARARQRAASTASPISIGQSQKNLLGSHRFESDYAIDEFDEPASPFQTLQSAHMKSLPGARRSPVARRFSEFQQPSQLRYSQPSIGGLVPERLLDLLPLGQDQDFHDTNMPASRRHSMATYSVHPPFNPPRFTYNEEEEELVSPMAASETSEPQEPFDAVGYFTGYGPASRAINASVISAAHPAPPPAPAPAAVSNTYTGPPSHGRSSGRRLYIVTFKCSRADIYYTYENTGLEIRPGDLVITEGDRGIDLGQVSHANVTLDQAKRLKAEALNEHFRWLVMFSQYSLSGAKDQHMLGALARAKGFPNMNRESLTSMGGQQEQDTRPKMIKRLAQQHEIEALREKEGSEAKAKRMGAQKAQDHNLPMEILDAEFQADYHKLTFFYYAEAYVNFNPLVVDIFKQYKIRIWMSAVNPASVVNPAGVIQIQPPSAIGPGAILPPRSNAPAAVGPGFGSPSYRQNDQQRPRNNATQPQFDDIMYAYNQQVAGFPGAQFQNQGYNQYGQHPGYGQQFNRFGGYPVPGGYPAGTVGGSPMNHGGYYPPSTFSSSPAYHQVGSNAGYRGAAPASFPGPVSTYPGGYSGASAGNPAYSGVPFGGYPNSGAGGVYSGGPGYGGNGGYYDPSMVAGMANMNLDGSK